MRFILLLILLIFSFWIQSAKLHSVFLFTAVTDRPHVPCCRFFVHLQIIHYKSYTASLYLISKIQLCARCAYVCFILHISLWFQRVFNLIVVWIIRREMENIHARLHAKDTSFLVDKMQRPSSQIPFMLWNAFCALFNNFSHT